MSAPKVAVYLTKRDTQILRRLIVEEAKRLGHPYQRPTDEPPKLKRLLSVAKKIWEARKSFDAQG